IMNRNQLCYPRDSQTVQRFRLPAPALADARCHVLLRIGENWGGKPGGGAYGRRTGCPRRAASSSARDRAFVPGLSAVSTALARPQRIWRAAPGEDDNYIYSIAL